MSLLIAGDIVPKENNIQLFENEDIEKILGYELNKIWKKADYKIFNLEAPITKCDNRIKKCGPNLKIEPRVIKGIKKLNPTVVLLANNHIMDYGEKGLKDTIDILNENNINYVGVGNKKQKLKKSYIIQHEDKKIAIYNCCETEFSIATSELPGANSCDLFSLYDDITNLKKENDYLIILYHGGKEHYRYPSPYLQTLCRKMIDYGADLIVCQHSHCIGCYENYKDKNIIYGQGNFIFSGQDNEYWNTSLIIDVDIENDFIVRYIPIKRTENGTILANETEKKEILQLFENRSKQIKQKNFVKENYKKFSNEYLDIYLQKCHGDNILYRILNKLCFHKLTKKLYSEKSLLSLLNIIECEAHRELFIEGLKNKIYNNANKL